MVNVMEGTSWEAIWPCPHDVVQLRTLANSWNTESKYGSYGEHFFLLQIDQHKYPEGSIDTLWDRYEFTPIKKQNSIFNRLRKYGLTPRGGSNASGSGIIPSFGAMMVECMDDHNREMSDRGCGQHLVTMTTTILLSQVVRTVAWMTRLGE